MEKQELAKKIYEVSHLTGEFKLRSGIVSNEYFDKYQFESRPELLLAIAENFQKMILEPNFADLKIEDFDLLAGLEVGGIPIATALGISLNKPIVFVRKKAKDYGTAKLVEGLPIENRRLLIVEDVVTSGGQIIISVEELRKKGAKIEKAICVIDREQGGKEALQNAGIELISLFTMSELKATGKLQ
jgi:orotate phosphoribosyltransferase